MLAALSQMPADHAILTAFFGPPVLMLLIGFGYFETRRVIACVRGR